MLRLGRPHRLNRRSSSSEASALNTASGTPDGNNPADNASPFLVAVPDYLLADWWLSSPSFLPLRRGRQPGGLRGVLWAVHHAVILQRSSRVVLPDILLGQVLWGGDKRKWPRNWRGDLVRVLANPVGSFFTDSIHKEAEQQTNCPSICALYGTGLAHHHFEVTITTTEDTNSGDVEDTFLGALEIFATYGGEYEWNPRFDALPEDDTDGPNDEELTKLKDQKQAIANLKRKGRIAAIYFLHELFGSSPRVGLTRYQRILFRAIPHELTRVRRRKTTDRADKAEIMIGGREPSSADQYAAAACPFLESNERYVAFNGNGRWNRRRLRGRGYKLRTWMIKARHFLPRGDDVEQDADQAEPNTVDAETDGSEPTWPQVRRFLRDLTTVSEFFDLVVGAFHPRKGTWLPLTDLAPLIRNRQGRAWLRQCLIRIYSKDDFLQRWRRFYAERLGFSVIPDRDREQVVMAQSPEESPEALVAYMTRIGMSAADLARQLGVSRSLVSQHLSGAREWTSGWKARITAWLGGREASQKV